MVSHCLLPYTLHPTRVTDHSATVIDNIFSNVTDFETVSGNIFNQIADHYSQFLIITKLQVDYKVVLSINIIIPISNKTNLFKISPS